MIPNDTCIYMHVHVYMTPARDPKQKKIMINPLKIGFFRLKTRGNVRDFLGDHFARVESSGDQNLTMFTLDFHVFSQNYPKMIPT